MRRQVKLGNNHKLKMTFAFTFILINNIYCIRGLWFLRSTQRYSRHGKRHETKDAFIVYFICVAVSGSGRISVSVTTTALRYYCNFKLRGSALRLAAVDK